VGRAALSIDPDLIASFAVNGKSPCCVLVITVERVFYRCTKAIVRSNCGTRPAVWIARACPRRARSWPPKPLAGWAAMSMTGASSSALWQSSVEKLY
jgi:hypothetical protein